MRVCLSGYYGSANIGDELLFEATKKIILDVFGAETEIVALGCFPEQLKRLHGISVAGPNSGWQNRGTLLHNKPEIHPVAYDIIRQSDLFVLGGGGLMGNDCIYNWPEVMACREQGIPAAAVGIGCDPFWTPAMINEVDDYFRAFRSITTRDALSLSSLEKFGVGERTLIRECADQVFGLYPFREPRVLDRPVRVNVCLSTFYRWFGGQGNPAQVEAIQNWADALTSIRAEGVDVRLYPFSPNLVGNYDWVRAQHLSNLALSLPVLDTRQVPFMEVINLLCDADMIVSDRYHGAVLSAVCGVPFMTVCQDPKLISIAQALGQPYMEPEKTQADAIKKTLTHSLTSRVELQKTLLDRRADLRYLDLAAPLRRES